MDGIKVNNNLIRHNASSSNNLRQNPVYQKMDV